MCENEETRSEGSVSILIEYAIKLLHGNSSNLTVIDVRSRTYTHTHTHTHTSGNDVGKLRATRVTAEKLPRRAINHAQISRDCRRVKLDCIFALIVRDSGTRVLVKRMINSSASSVKPLYIFSARHRFG